MHGPIEEILTCAHLFFCVQCEVVKPYMIIYRIRRMKIRIQFHYIENKFKKNQIIEIILKCIDKNLIIVDDYTCLLSMIILTY